MSVINTNISSMIGQANLGKAQNNLQTSMERLSSGLRINSAKDDAAGQAIANRMTAQITGLSQAQRNANDGISLVQTAEGALDQVNDNVQRIRELTVQAANGTNSSDDLISIQEEITARVDEIDRISEQTQFNGSKVLAGDGAGAALDVAIQVGANDTESITISIAQITSSDLGVDTIDVTTADFAAETPLDDIDTALGTIDGLRSDLGAVQNRFEDAIHNLQTNETNLADARSRIQDADYAAEVADMTRSQILQQAGTSMLAQANQIPQSALALLG